MIKGLGKIWLGMLFLALIAVICGLLLFGSRNKNNEGETQKVIGAVYMTLNNPYFEVLDSEIGTVVETNGDLYMCKDSSMDAEDQIQQMKELIDYGVDLLVVNPVDWKEIKEGLQAANDAGVPVVVVDAPVYNDELVTTSIYSNNYYCGQLIAYDLMSRLDKANILFMVQSGSKSATDRIQGFKDMLNQSGWDYHTVAELECAGQLEEAQPIVESLLKKHRDIDVVVALNDPSAMGAMAALEDKNMLKDILVYGVDGAPEAKTLIHEGKMTATVAQSPVSTGKYVAEYIYKILNGEKVPAERILPVKLITQDNVNTYSLTGWQ